MTANPLLSSLQNTFDNSNSGLQGESRLTKSHRTTLQPFASTTLSQ